MPVPTLVKLEHPKLDAECDTCGRHGITHAAIARGATGRWCHVLWMCSACGGGGSYVSEQEARDAIDALGTSDYADF